VKIQFWTWKESGYVQTDDKKRSVIHSAITPSAIASPRELIRCISAIEQILGQTGNNYDISNKFQEICLVLSDKDIGNQRIGISKKFIRGSIWCFSGSFFQEPILPGKAKTNQSGDYHCSGYDTQERNKIPCWTRIVFFQIVNTLIDLRLLDYILFLNSCEPSNVIFLVPLSW
jgi:hypothetical protein